jgi:glyoxylase-like metal-dependent hydrolase (beta-lactamase superfamily II)
MLRIERVLAPNPSEYTLEGTNTWVVGQGPAIVIDPGPPDPAHLEEVLRTAGGPIAHVLVTHDHEDHAEGAADLARLAGAGLRAARLDDAERLRDGETLCAGSLELVAVHTPGHSADHFVFFAPEEGALFTGDAVLGRGTSFIDPPDGDLARYLASLHHMLDLEPKTIYPGHGPVVLDARAKLREYIVHRSERESQVLEALAAGSRTVHELVASIYVDHPPEVHPLAARSVTAHLLKLEAEGRAAKAGRGDDAVWSAVGPRACRRCGRPVKGRGSYCSSCSLVLLQEGAAAPPDRDG